MRTLRTHAIILKRRDMGEADRLVTLYTPAHGKRDALAKGARKPTSSKTGHVELFTRIDALISTGRSIDILAQAEVLEPFLPLREDLLRGAYAAYCVELLDRMTLADDQPAHDIYALLDATLARLALESDLRRAVRYYELHLLDMLGFRPELQRCVVTQELLLPQDQFFSYSEGGVVSPEGARHTLALVPLPLATLKLLRHLQRTPYNKLIDLRIDAPTHNDSERIMHGYLRYLLESRLQSVDFIRRLET